MFLGLDLGTTNVKALLADPAGRVAASGSAPVGLSHPAASAVEQDLEEIWQATRSAVAQVTAGGRGRKVRALGVSSQGGALQVIDAGGRPVGPVVGWMDGRGAPFDRALTRKLGRRWFARRVGHGASGVAVGQVLRLRREEPGRLARPNRVAFVGDAIVGRLCGRRAHDATSLSIAALYNPALGRADPDLLRLLELSEDRLPDLVPATAPAGVLLAEAARRLGLPAGIPVSPAVHDQYAAALGCGATAPGDVMLGTGTAWVLLAVTRKLSPPVIDEAFVCPHVVQGLYGQMLSMVNGGSAFRWAVKLLGLSGRSAAELDEMMAAVPPGCEGLAFRPLLVPIGGARVAPGASGSLTGLRLSHGRAHVLRAVVEGLSFELARYLGFLAAGGIRVRRLVMCGGPAASRITPQVVADATGLCVWRTAEPAVSALGAAVLARALVEPRTPLAQLARRMAPKTRRVSPGPARRRMRALAAAYAAALTPARKGRR